MATTPIVTATKMVVALQRNFVEPFIKTSFLGCVLRLGSTAMPYPANRSQGYTNKPSPHSCTQHKLQDGAILPLPKTLVNSFFGKSRSFHKLFFLPKHSRSFFGQNRLAVMRSGRRCVHEFARQGFAEAGGERAVELHALSRLQRLQHTDKTFIACNIFPAKMWRSYRNTVCILSAIQRRESNTKLTRSNAIGRYRKYKSGHAYIDGMIHKS